MAKKNDIKKKKDSGGLIDALIIIGIVFLIGSLVLMFVKNGETENYIKEISYSEYQSISKKDEYSIILLTSPTCSHCINYKPFVNNVALENKINVYNIDLTKIEYSEYLELHDKYTALKKQFDPNGNPAIPTPATLIIKNDEEVASIIGDIGYNGFTKLLKDNKVIK